MICRPVCSVILYVWDCLACLKWCEKIPESGQYHTLVENSGLYKNRERELSTSMHVLFISVADYECL